jgi:hypothetical protein
MGHDPGVDLHGQGGKQMLANAVRFIDSFLERQKFVPIQAAEPEHHAA